MNAATSCSICRFTVHLLWTKRPQENLHMYVIKYIGHDLIYFLNRIDRVQVIFFCNIGSVNYVFLRRKL